MALVADDPAAWLIGLLADASRRPASARGPGLPGGPVARITFIALR